MRGSFFFAMGLFLAGCIGIGGWFTAASRGESLLSWVRDAPDQEPVLVLLVGDERGVAAVRSAVDADRILADSPGAFVLREGRVVASGVEAVGGPLAEAGLAGRPLELLSVSLAAPVKRTRARKQHSRIAELAAKDFLTPMEAAALLENVGSL